MILLILDFWIIISSIGCFLSGVFTVLLFIVGKKQIKKYIGLGEIDLYYKLKNDFSSPESLRLYKNILEKTVGIRDNFGTPMLVEMMSYDLSDDLLNHIEDMCIFYERDLIRKDTIIEGYGTIVKLTYENPEIKKYIELKRVSYNIPSLHTGLKILYNLINEKVS